MKVYDSPRITWHNGDPCMTWHDDKTRTFWLGGKVERSQLIWDVRLRGQGVPNDLLIWCQDHCADPWGWWFDPHNDGGLAHIGFSDRAEMVEFMLCNNFS